VKRILKFLLTFLLLAGVAAPCWMLLGAPLYHRLIVPIANVVIVPEGYRSTLTHKDSAGVHSNQALTGQTPASPYGKLVRWANNSMLVVFPESNQPGSPVKPLTGLYLSTLTFNAVPLIALFLATSGVAARTRMKRLLFAFPILSASHFFHMYLNIFSAQHAQVNVKIASVTAVMAFYFTRFIFHLQGFMEQAGSMLFPFLLWLIFYREQTLIGLNRIMPKPAPIASVEPEKLPPPSGSQT